MSTEDKTPQICRNNYMSTEDKEPPRAKALDTVLVLDTSDSVARQGLDELKAAVHTFVDCEFASEVFSTFTCILELKLFPLSFVHCH